MRELIVGKPPLQVLKPRTLLVDKTRCAELDALQGRHTELVGAAEQQGCELAAAREMLGEAEDRALELGDGLAGTRRQLETVRTELESTRSELGVSQSELQTARSELQSRDGRVAELEGEAAAKGASLGRLQVRSHP